MTSKRSCEEFIIDYITGHQRPNVGPEANRQQVERLLVGKKGYEKNDIQVDTPINLVMAEEETYTSRIDLVVTVKGYRFMVIKCAPGSLASREREVIAAGPEYGVFGPILRAPDGWCGPYECCRRLPAWFRHCHDPR